MSALVYQGFRLSLGILYPAYSSFKAVRSKNVKEYVKWMMYWIVFALYSFCEVFADFLLIWFPFYYEIKICFILWLVSPATKGSSVLYRKVVHPQLLKREKDIDANISKATDQGYATLITLGSRGFNMATNIVLSTAIKGSSKLSDQLQKSFSLNDLSSDTADYRRPRRLDARMSVDDDELDNRLISERYRLEMTQKENLDKIDEEVTHLPVLESSDVQKIQRRRKIESTLREVMSESSPSLAQSLVGSVRVSRKYKSAAKEESDSVIEALNEPQSETIRPSASIGTSSGTISHYFRSSGSSTSLGTSVDTGYSSSADPSSSSTSSGSVISDVPSNDPAASGSSETAISTGTTSSGTSSFSETLSALGSSTSRRLKLSFFSSHSSSKPK